MSLPSPPETRASLILRLPNAADAAAWEEVVSIYGPLVFRLALKQGLQHSDAEDLVQEVFTAVSKQIDDWLKRTDRGKFRAWVLRIARNIAVNLLTRVPMGGQGVGDIGAIPNLSNEIGHLSSQFDIEYQREVLRWAADQVRAIVTEKTWRAFHMTHIEQLSITDTASQLGLTEGSVYIARSRVMSRLRELAQQFETRK